MSRVLHVCAYIFPLAFLTWYGALKVTDREFARLLTYESGWLEWFQFWCFLGGALGGAVAAWFQYRSHAPRTALFFLIFSIGTLFVAFEEINWGQWLLGIELPQYFVENNTQKNLTLHNLKTIQPYLHFVTMLGASGIAVLALFGRSLCTWRIPPAAIPERYLALYFFPVAAFYLFTDYLSKPLVSLGFEALKVGFDHRTAIIIFSDQEAFECLVAFGVLLYAGRALIFSSAARSPVPLQKVPEQH